jgi:hypothetical protein
MVGVLVAIVFFDGWLTRIVIALFIAVGVWATAVAVKVQLCAMPVGRRRA